MGFVGVGGQGTGDMQGFLGFPEVQGVAVCDTDKTHRERGRGIINSRNKNDGCFATDDFREVVTRPDIDAIFCATPVCVTLSRVACHMPDASDSARPRLTLGSEKTLGTEMDRCFSRRRTTVRRTDCR